LSNDVAVTGRNGVCRMPYRYVVLGAGRQGVALAYDLAKNCEAERVDLLDSDQRSLEAATERLAQLLPDRTHVFAPAACNVSKTEGVVDALRGGDVVISAVPYRFNVHLTDLAIEAGASFCDLGGNTEIVREQLQRHERAKAAGLSVVPDCGLAPGLGNILAAHGIQQMDEAEHAHVRCGGLPERPVGPLGYKLLFNFEGLINEYSGEAEFLRDGRRVEISTLTEVESIEFAEPVGRCEAAVTSGGTSTCPETFEGRLQTYDYKTVRYPGHFAVMRALFGLGCFEEQVELPDGMALRLKDVMQHLFEQRLAFPEVRDITVLRVTVHGRHQGSPRTIQYDLFDRHDEATGFAAMERTTAFPTALVAYMQARRLIEPGARPPERAIPLARYVEELPLHDINVTSTLAGESADG
jgi:lysine 6-dehydrogenase